MTKRPLSLPSVMFLCVVFVFAGTFAFASHLRGTSVSWSPTGTSGTVQFTIQYSQRTSYGCTSGAPCVLGGTVDIPFDFGDGNNTTLSATITSVNAAEDYLSAVATVTHTYTGAGPYTAFYENSARVSTIKSGENQNLRMETLVSPLASPVNHSPVASMPAIVTVPLQASTGFTVSAADQDGDHLSFRLSTASEMYDTPSFSCSAQQPPGLSINNSGQVTWDTTQITAAGCGFSAPASGDLWTVQFMVQDLNSSNQVKSKIPVDLIIKFISSNEAPPTVTFSNPGPITAIPGTPITFTIGSNDTTPNSRVTFNVTGLPIGATATNTNQALAPPVSSTFSWTPTAAQTGSYVVTYTVTNDTFEQALASVTINVPSTSPPVTSCPTSLTAQYNNALAIPVQVSDPQGDALTVVWSADNSAVHTDNVAATSSTTSLSLNQTFLTLGAHTVSLTATDTDQLSTSCSIPITVTAADQSISFPTLPTVTYGDLDVTLAATSTSNLPVTFSATQSCSIVSGALHTTGAGSCSISASQAGNSTYNPAQQVTQSFQIAQRPLTVNAQSTSRQYGVANPTFTGTVTGIVNNDAVTATYSSIATTTSPVGTYAIVPALSGAALVNYAPTLNNGTLTVTAGPASKLATSTLASTLIAGGTLGTATVTVKDAYDNTVTTSTTLVTATITGPNGYSQTVPGTAVAGVASLNLSSLNLIVAGTYTVTTSSAGLTGTSSTVMVTAGSASKLAASAIAPTLTSGSSPGTLAVTVEDTNGNAVTTSTAVVTATITGPNGYSQIVSGTSVNGVANLNLSSLNLSGAGTYTISTASSGLTGTNSTVTVTAGAASKLATSAIISTLTSGGNLGTITSSVQDANSNTATTSTALVTATITGPNGYSQTVSGTAVNGMASLNLSSLNLTIAGTYTVNTSSTGLTGTSAIVTVTAGAASELVLGNMTTSIISGQTLGSVLVTSEDVNGNVATSYTGPITATLNGSNGFSQTVSGTAVNGKVTLDLSSLTPSAAGTYPLTVAAPALTAASTTIMVAAAAQIVALPNLPDITFGAGGTLLPSTSSAGLPIVYTVTGPAVMNGSTLSITGAGKVTITATQAGDAAHSPVVVTNTFVVAQASSTTSLSTSSGIANTGAPIELTAQVASTAGTPNGTVTFMDGATVLGTAPVAQGGTATLTVTTLPTGVISLTASYGGDANHVASTSTPTPAQVEDFGISATAGTPSIPVVPGAATSFTIALTPGSGGFTNAITLTATGLPPGATYSFSPAVVTPGSAVVSAILTVQTAKPVSTARNLSGAAGATLALLALPFSISRKVRKAFKGARLFSVLGALVLLGGAAGLSGCGTSNGFFGQPGQTYTVTVTGTNGTLAHSTQIVLNVQ